MVKFTLKGISNLTESPAYFQQVNGIYRKDGALAKSLRGLNLRWLIDWRDKNRPLFAGLQRDAISTVDSSFDQVPAIQGTSKFILSDLGGAGSVQEISPIVLEAGENPEAFMADPLLAHKLEDYMEQYPQQFMIR